MNSIFVFGSICIVLVVGLLSLATYNELQPTNISDGYLLIAQGVYGYRNDNGGIKEHPYIGDYNLDNLHLAGSYSLLVDNNNERVTCNDVPILSGGKYYKLYQKSTLFFNKYIVIKE